MSVTSATDSAKSPIERLDPRIRIVLACGFVLAAVSMRGQAAQIAMLASALALTTFTDISFRDLLRRLLHVESFMLVLLILLPLTMDGRSLASIGPFSISDTGLARAIAIALKVNACVIATMALLATLEPVRLGRGLSGLGAPARLVHLLLFLVRYHSLFREEATRLWDAMRARGFSPRLDLHTLRTYGHFAGMLLVRATERAERVEESMRCRGFSGRFPLRATRSLQSIDLIVFGLLAMLVTAILILDRFA